MEIMCGDPVVMLRKRRRAANGVTRRSHARIFVLASDKKRQRARGLPQVDVMVAQLMPRGRGRSRPELEHLTIPL
jgi:hypothetical protein